MKIKKIAVFSNAWSDEYVYTILSGIMKGANEYGADVYAFLDYVSCDLSEESTQGEMNVFSLPTIEEFDGILLLGNTFNKLSESELLCKQILAKKVPSLSIEYHFDGMDYIGTDNYSGMAELTEHLFQVHKIKSLMWMGGPKDNKESAERFQAVWDTAQHFGVTIPQENMLYSDWSYYDAQNELKVWMNRYRNLPEAIICANDMMALGVCAYLKSIGYQVPEQIKVTGFDYLENGRVFYPAITTVNRGWQERGYQGIQQLIRKINGEPYQKEQIYHSAMAVAESCGCKMDAIQKERQLNACCMRFNQQMEGMLYHLHLSMLDESTTRIKDKAELNQKLNQFFEYSHSYEGNYFGIYLDTSFVESFEHDIPLRTKGFSEEMEVISSLKNGTVQPIRRIKTKDMLADYNPDCKHTHIYIFLSLHDEDKCMGYVSFCDKIDAVKDCYLFLWAKHLSEGLKRTKQSIRVENMNRKLEQISMTDEMTGLYNRLGYEKYAIPHLDSWIQEGNTGAIMVVDIDKMKVINDKYGHLRGDIAIKVVAKTIQENLPEAWNAVRYGGDEFVLLGRSQGEKNVELLKKKLMESLAKKVQKLMLPFPLSISIGSVMANPGQNISMEEYFRMADKAMYIMKNQLHNKEDESKQSIT